MTDENQAPNRTERAYRWIEKHPLLTIIFAAVIIFIMVLIYWAIWADSSPAWTGFGAYDEETAGPRAKTLWDWLGLLIVPAAVAIGAAVISYFQKRTELDIAKKARETEQKIATDRQMQATLEAYYDRMTDLVIRRGSGESGNLAMVVSIARAHTVAVVKSLDDERNQQVFAFLQASNLIGKDSPINMLEDANFSKAHLRGVDMSGVMLRGTNFSESDLQGANLRETYLTDAKLIKTNLSSVDLSGANLREADMTEANLHDAILREADLSKAILLDANLTMAFLYKANLRESILRNANFVIADLTEADLRGANLSRANLGMTALSRANLSDIKGWEIVQFDQAYETKMDGVIMPDGEKLVGRDNSDGLTYGEWKAQYLAKQRSS